MRIITKIFQLSEKRVLFLANHLGLADHFVIMSALRNKGTVVEKVHIFN